MTKEDKRKIGERIRNTMYSKGVMKQSDMASILLGDSSRNKKISDWCCGVSLPNVDMLIKIANFGGVSLDWLLTGKKSEDFQVSRETTVSIEKMASDDYISTLVDMLISRFPAKFEAELDNTNGKTSLTLVSRNPEFMVIASILDKLQLYKDSGHGSVATKRLAYNLLSEDLPSRVAYFADFIRMVDNVLYKKTRRIDSVGSHSKG